MIIMCSQDTYHAQYLGDKMMDFVQTNLEYIGKSSALTTLRTGIAVYLTASLSRPYSD